MKREIKFRGKSIHPFSKGKWVYGYLMEGWKQGTLCIGKWENIGGEATVKDNFGSSYEPIDPETVGQYTGLKDKNGVEIFEGDICKYRYGRWTYIGKVAFNTHACIFEMRRTEMVGSHGERAIKTQLLNHIDKVEVIGNIHDNPDLLEVE